MVEAFYYIIIFILALSFALLAKFVFKNQFFDTKSKLYKALSLVLSAVFTVRYLSKDIQIAQLADHY